MNNEINKIEDLKQKGKLLKSEAGTRFFYRALSLSARKHKKVRRALEKAGRRSNRK